MAAQLYSVALKGILTACPSVLTERERKSREKGEMEKTQGAKGVGVQIQFPVTVRSGSLFR